MHGSLPDGTELLSAATARTGRQRNSDDCCGLDENQRRHSSVQTCEYCSHLPELFLTRPAAFPPFPFCIDLSDGRGGIQGHQVPSDQIMRRRLDTEYHKTACHRGILSIHVCLFCEGTAHQKLKKI